MQSSKYYIPKYLDEPMRIVIFTVDEVLIMGLVLIVFMQLGFDLLGLLASAVAYISYSKFKKQGSSAFLQRYCYWKFSAGSCAAIPSSYQRKYKG
jgi:conjugal transfer pilus assembly protein TraL